MITTKKVNNITVYLGNQSDLKPITAEQGSRFIVLDTNSIFIFKDGSWYEEVEEHETPIPEDFVIHMTRTYDETESKWVYEKDKTFNEIKSAVESKGKASLIFDDTEGDYGILYMNLSKMDTVGITGDIEIHFGCICNLPQTSGSSGANEVYAVTVDSNERIIFDYSQTGGPI